ncbi:hypothetical protein CsSME_00054287 [Camellia sinensis var. sinensis]
MENVHWRLNQTGKIWVDVVELTEEEEVRAGIVGFYEHLFRRQEEGWRPGVDGVEFGVISDSDVLGQPFSKEKVVGALKGMSFFPTLLGGHKEGCDGSDGVVLLDG